jgi:beta-lactamase class A
MRPSEAVIDGLQEPSALQKLADSELAGFPGRAGVWVKHLKTGDEAGVRADDVFNSASVIKIPVAMMLFQMAEQDRLSLAQRIPIRKEDVRGGSGVFRHHDPGLEPTLRDVILQMIITSDNTATDIAIARAGGVAAVNDWIKTNGYAHGMKLTQTTGELFAKYAALPQGANRNEKTGADRAYWLGEITPRAIGRMLEAIERGTLLQKASNDELVRMLRAQQAGARRLPHYLTVPVGHKTGDFPPVLANDVGIIYARSGPIVISFCANAITGSYGEAEDRIGRFAERVVAHFDREPGREHEPAGR